MASSDEATFEPFRRGFTLLELMITVAIAGLLSTAAISSYGIYVEKAKVARTIAELQGIARVLEAMTADGASLPDSLAGIAPDSVVDPWGGPYQYLAIEGNLPKGHASTPGELPHVSVGKGKKAGASDSKGSGGGGGGGGSIMGQVRKDRFLAPINSDFDLYSMGPDGESKAPLQNPVSRDDVIRAGSGSYYGIAERF